jgi:hypothetical protein
MHTGLVAGLIAASLSAANSAPAQQRPNARAVADRQVTMETARRPVFVRMPPPLQSAFRARPVTTGALYRSDPEDFRVTGAPAAENRARLEVEAAVARRPRVFSFRPMMSLTFDTNDLDGPARIGGIAPRLLGAPKPR